MPVETAADLASMFDDEEFAEAAVYGGPGGGGSSDCLVIVDRGQGRARFVAGESQAVGAQRKLWVQIGEGDLMLPAKPVREGTFTLELDGEVLKVTGLPEIDHAGKLCSCELVVIS